MLPHIRMTKIEEIESEHPDDIPAQITALLDAANDSVKDFKYQTAGEYVHAAYKKALESKDQLPTVIPKEILFLYLNQPNEPKVISTFRTELEKIDNGKEIWKSAMPNILASLETEFQRFFTSLRPNFYIQTNLIQEIIAKLQGDEPVPLNTILSYLNIAKNCKGELKTSELAELAAAANANMINQISQIPKDKIRSVDEKLLKQIIINIKFLGKSSETKKLEKFEQEIAFKFVLSPFIGKKLDGLQRLNEAKSLSSSIAQQIHDEKVIEYVLTDIHHDLVPHFATLLRKMWSAGFYDYEILKQFWITSLNQHSAVIGTFFNAWTSLFDHIPKGKSVDLWNLIIETTTFPSSSLQFLTKIAPKCDDKTKAQVMEVLWKASDSDDRMEFVNTLAAYTPTQLDIRKQYIQRCIDLIHNKPESVVFSLKLLNLIWRPETPELSRKIFDDLLKHCHVEIKDSQTLFQIFSRIAAAIEPPLTVEEFNMIQIQSLHVIKEKTLIATTFFNDLISLHKGKLFTNELMHELLKWLSNMDNIDSKLFELIMIIFRKINNITVNAAIPNFDLIGIESLWKLLFTSSLPEISHTIVDLVVVCENSTSINSFINKCVEKLDTVGSLHALTLLVSKIEDPLDLPSFGFRRNMYVSPSLYVNIKLTAEYEGKLKIYYQTPLSTLKAMVSRLTNVDASKITLLNPDDSQMQPHPVFFNDQVIKVCYPKFSPAPVRVWNKKSELPSQILKEPTIFNRLFDILKGENKDLAERALRLCNYLESNQEEEKLFRSIADDPINWSEHLDIKYPFIFIYRLHMLGNILNEMNRRYLQSFFSTGGFKQVISILFMAQRELFTKQIYFDLLIAIVAVLIESCQTIPENNEYKTKAYEEIGVSEATNSLMNCILDLLKNTKYDVFQLISIMHDLIMTEPSAIIEQPIFKEFFITVIFNQSDRVRARFLKLLEDVPIKSLEDIVLSNLDNSVNGFCFEYFLIVSRIVDKTKEPEKLWNLLFETLKTKLYAPKENISLAVDDEDTTTDREELEKQIKILCSTPASPQFVDGIINQMYHLTFKLDKYPHAKSIISFLSNQIIFNTIQYIPLTDKGFNLLTKLINYKPKHFSNLLDKLIRFHRSQPPKSTYYPRLSFQCPIKGLNNMGCTCFLNSSIQQIFRIQKILESVLKYKPDADTDIATDWLPQLQLLFAKLIYAPLSAIDASPFVKNWKGWDGMPINPLEQQDAVEFVQSVLDKLDEKLSDHPVKYSVKGKIIHEVKNVSNGVIEATNKESFTTFPIEVKSYEYLNDAYQAFLIPDILSGKNQYKTDDGLIDAERSSSLSKPPEVLIMQLKRFEYNINMGAYTKINSKFTFPFETDISSIITQNIGSDVRDPFLYELCGVVIHYGSAMGGHYFSYVKNELTNDWSCCNDSNVSSLLPNNVLENTTGGTVTRDVYDPIKKTTVKQQFENSESAYLLVYKKKGRELPKENFEPITIMPPVMVKALLSEIEKMILDNTLYTDKYAEFITSMIAESANEKTYEFLFQLMMSFLENSGYGSAFDKFHTVTIEKCKADKNFAKYILQQTDTLINSLLQTFSYLQRVNFVTIITSAMESNKEEAKAFIDVLISKFSDSLAYWQNYDHFFKPILYYLENIDHNRQDILEELFKFLNETIPEKIDTKQKDSFYNTVNLGSVFKSILLIISKLGLTEQYQQKALDKDFMNLWFQSDVNTFDFANFITYFLKDNKELTDGHLNFIIKHDPPLGILPIAAHFAIACTFKDTFTEYRIKTFFDFITAQKWNDFDLSNFIKEAASKIAAHPEGACPVLISLHQHWLSKWLITNSASTRASCLRLIYCMFPQYQQFMRPENFSGRPDRPEKSDNPPPVSPELNTLFKILIDSGKELIKVSLAGSKIKSNNFYLGNSQPAAQYFELLAWIVHNGDLESELLKHRSLFENMVTSFSSLKNNIKNPLYDLLHFISIFKFSEPFITKNEVGQYLKALSNFPSCTQDVPSYVDHISENFGRLFKGVAEQCDVQITSSHIYRKICKFCLFDSSTALESMYDLTMKMLNENSVQNIARSLFRNSLFNAHLKYKSKKYLALCGNTLLIGESVLKFMSKKCPHILVTTLTGMLEAATTSQLLNDSVKLIDLLILFSKRYIVLYKNKGGVFNKMNGFISFWKSKLEFLSMLVTQIQNVNATRTFSVSAIKLLKIVLSSDQAFGQFAFSVIDSESSDFYSRLASDVRCKFAKFTVLMLSLHKKPRMQEIITRDLRNLVKIEIFDTRIFFIYSTVFKNQDIINHEVLGLYTKFFEHATTFDDFKVAEFGFKQANGNEEIMKWINCFTVFLQTKLDEIKPKKGYKIHIDNLSTAKNIFEQLSLSGIQIQLNADKNHLQEIISKLNEKEDNTEAQTLVGLLIFFVEKISQ